MSIRVRERSKRLFEPSEASDGPIEDYEVSELSSDTSSRAERPVSATLLQLISERERASEEFIRADQAQKAYSLKKRATAGQEGLEDAKAHFKETASHFKLACKGLYVATAALPSMISENNTQRKQKSEAKRRERIMDQQRRLQEALDREMEE